MKANLQSALGRVLLNGTMRKACFLDRQTSSSLIQNIQEESKAKGNHNFTSFEYWSTNLIFAQTETLRACGIFPESLAEKEQTIDEIIDSFDFTELRSQGLDDERIKLIKLILKAEIADIRLRTTDDSDTTTIHKLSEISEKSQDELLDLAFETHLTTIVKKYLEKYSSLERLEDEEIGDDELDRQAGDYFKAKYIDGERLEAHQKETLDSFLDTSFGVFFSKAKLISQISSIFIYHDGTEYKLDEKTFSSIYKNLNDDAKRVLKETLSIYVDRLPI